MRGQRQRLEIISAALPGFDNVLEKETRELPEFESVLIEFPDSLDEYQKDLAQKLACYWAKIRFITNGSTENKWLSNKHFWINASSYNSGSSDWRKRDIFLILQELLEDGTSSDRYPGIGMKAEQVFLDHPLQLKPAKSPEEQNRRQKLNKASKLLY